MNTDVNICIAGKSDAAIDAYPLRYRFSSLKS